MENVKKEITGSNAIMDDSVNSATLAGADFDVSPAVFSSMPSTFSCESEDALSRRFMRPVKKKPDLVYEFTRDPALINQYCRLYDAESGASVPQFEGIQSEYNKKGHIIIVRQGKLCVGGSRLSVSTPRQPALLSMETNGFLLDDHFPELKKKEMRYGQLSRLVLLPDFRDGDVARLMYHHLYRKAIALNLDIVFVMAPLVNARSYRKNALAYGMKSVKIHTNIDIPSCVGFEEIKEYLLEIVIDKSFSEHDIEFAGNISHSIHA